MLFSIFVGLISALWKVAEGRLGLTVCGSHLCYQNHPIFLSGVNQAWQSYGYDFGNNQYASRHGDLEYYIREVAAAGGNSIRMWVHTEGQNSPKWDGQGNVIGTDPQGTLINDLKQYLTYAGQHNIFVFLTLWNGALIQDSSNYQMQMMIKSEAKTKTYIQNALVPMVRELKNYPALAGYDIMNEMEGVLIPNQYNQNACFDTRFLSGSGAGWAASDHNGIYYAQDLMRFINLQAAAIRHEDGQSLVTSGGWNPRSSTNNWGQHNLYSDDCLRAAGGNHDGVLHFFSPHSYDLKDSHTFDSYSPFVHNAGDYGNGKPVVIAEFSHARGGGKPIEDLFRYAYDHGYAGAWSWHARGTGADTDDFASQKRGMSAIRGRNGAGGVINVKIY